MKENKSKVIHIAIIIIGAIFVLLSAFHTNIWFDEAYSVSIANHSFVEIWQISSHDVHPILYYWILHILNLIFGANLIVYRLFSVLCIILLGVLGYTHIRKDFGNRVGMIFSYLSFFLPAVCIYAVELRMYSLAMYLAAILGIYAYRIVTKEFSKKNWIIFAISSLCLAYTHYYGLMAAGIINVVVFVYILAKKKDDKRYIRSFIIQAVIEIILYLPWIGPFLYRSLQGGGGFWITVKFPDTLMDLLNFQYCGDLGNPFGKKSLIGLFLAVLLYVYIVVLGIRNKNTDRKFKMNPAIAATLVYIAVIIGAWVISAAVPILYSRYLLVITGLLIFVLSYYLAKEKHVAITVIVLALLTGMSIYNEAKLIKENYAENNLDGINYIKENIQDGDIIIYNRVNMAILNTYFPNNTQYFLNFERWGVHEAYKAFAPSMKIAEDWSFLDTLNGRIWLVDSEGDSFVYDNIDRDAVKILKDRECIKVDYHGYQYDVTLVEK